MPIGYVHLFNYCDDDAALAASGLIVLLSYMAYIQLAQSVLKEAIQLRNSARLADQRGI